MQWRRCPSLKLYRRLVFRNKKLMKDFMSFDDIQKSRKVYFQMGYDLVIRMQSPL